MGDEINSKMFHNARVLLTQPGCRDSDSLLTGRGLACALSFSFLEGSFSA